VVDESGNRAAVLAYGSSHFAVVEARDQLREAGVDVDYMRLRALPFSPEVAAFIERHDRVHVVEQNRDGQLFSLLRQELPGRLIDKLVSVRHYNGVPIDAHAITDPVLDVERPAAVSVQRSA
jgi:2-oxoglutarate/2-oxoacid ferredoxin oxidoreductase subunit alpha